MEENNPDIESLQRKYRILSSKARQAPNSSYLLYHLGVTCLDLGYRDEALLNLKKAVEMNPDMEEAKIKLNKYFNQEETGDIKIPEKVLPFWKDLGSVFTYPFAKEYKQGRIELGRELIAALIMGHFV